MFSKALCEATENIGHELSSAKNVFSFVTLLKIKKPYGSSFQLAEKCIRQGKSPSENIITYKPSLVCKISFDRFITSYVSRKLVEPSVSEIFTCHLRVTVTLKLTSSLIYHSVALAS